ncbi:MAG: metal-dependent transcriptional regulator [Planctomycetota bacterium]|nr:metal-dependent transcriptional regulator [Planctomycetota bacterium]
MPSESEENYLRAIWKLAGEDSDEWISTGQVADRVGVSPPSATSMVQQLCERGWLHHKRYQGVRLTVEGRELAVQTVRRHRILETYLATILGISWDRVDAEVERLEHSVSDEVICRMEEALDFPDRDPHGSPIPDRQGRLPGGVDLNLAQAPLSIELKVVRVVDALPEVLNWLGERGIKPGEVVFLEAREPAGGPVLLRVVKEDRSLAISGDLSRSICVKEIA